MIFRFTLLLVLTFSLPVFGYSQNHEIPATNVIPSRSGMTRSGGGLEKNLIDNPIDPSSDFLAIDQNHINENYDDGIGFSSVGINTPEYPNLWRNNISSNIEEFTFDTLSPFTKLNSIYSGINFSEGYVVINSSNSLDFPPYSGDMVVQNSFEENNITFLNPISRFTAFFSNNFTGIITIAAFDGEMNLITSDDLIPLDKNQIISLFDPDARISYIKVLGQTGFEKRWTMDSMVILHSNRNLIDFDDLDTDFNLPSYKLVRFPETSITSNGELFTGTSGKIGAVIPFGFPVSFSEKITYINFFVKSYLPSDIVVVFSYLNQKVDVRSISQVDKLSFISYRGEVDSIYFEYTGNLNGSNLSPYWVLDNFYFEIGSDPRDVRTVSESINGLDRDPVDPRIDTIQMQVSINFSGVIYDRVTVQFDVYNGSQNNWTKVISYNESTIIAGEGVYLTSLFEYMVEFDDDFIVNYTINYEDYPIQTGESPIFASHAFQKEKFVVHTTENDMIVFDNDGDGIDDSFSINLNVSYYYANNANLSIWAFGGRKPKVTTQTYTIPCYSSISQCTPQTFYRIQKKGGGVLFDEIYGEFVNGTGNYSTNFEFFNDYLIEGSTYYGIFVFEVNGKELGTLYFEPINIKKNAAPNINVSDFLEFTDADNDGVEDSFTINVNVSYQKTTTVFYYQVDVITSTEKLRVTPNIVASLEFSLKLNRTLSGSVIKTLSFQSNKTGIYKLAFKIYVPTSGNPYTLGYTYFETPLSFWLDSVPLPLDGVGDDPGISSLPNQNNLPLNFSIYPIALFVFIAIKKYKKKRSL